LWFFIAPRVFRLTRAIRHQHHHRSSSPTTRHRQRPLHHFDTTVCKDGNLDDSLYIHPCHRIVNHLSLFLRYLPTETSHLSIAGPHYLCTLVSHIPHSISLRASIKVSKYCPRICKIAILVRAHRILTKERISIEKKLLRTEKEHKACKQKCHSILI
jgi:hypothetical protein